MNKLSFLLAWRALRLGTRQQSIAPMIGVCFLGITLGTLALALTVCIMQGFETATRQALQSIHPALMIRATDKPLNYAKIKKVLDSEFPAITASAPSSEEYVIVKGSDQGIGTVLLLRGIDPQHEARVSAMEHKLVQPKNATLYDLLQKNHIVIGKKLADQLQLAVGDTITLLYLPHKRSNLHLDEAEVTISGLFDSGIEDVDTMLALANNTLLNSLLPDTGITHIGLHVQDQSTLNQVRNALKKRFDLEVVTWQDQYPALVSALKLEKYVAFIIIALISLVASMNIISLLFMQITQKQRELALFLASGMNKNAVRSIFLLIGSMIGIGGAICGLALAAIVGVIIKNCTCIPLPDIYYTTHLPIELDPFVFAIVFITVIGITVAATLVPLRSISRINIADVIRFNG